MAQPPSPGARGLLPPSPQGPRAPSQQTHASQQSGVSRASQPSQPSPGKTPGTAAEAYELYGFGPDQGGVSYTGGHLRVPPQAQPQTIPLPPLPQQQQQQQGLHPTDGRPKRRKTSRAHRAGNIKKSPGETKRFLEGDGIGPYGRETPLSQRHRDWKIWPIYVKEAMERDRELAEDWDEDMDVLLIFAGLFSAVVTSFLSQNAIGNLQADYSQYATLLALAQARNISLQLTDSCTTPDDSTYDPNCFTPGWQDQVINGFWFAALTFSLSAALLAMLSKTWIREYSAGLASIPYDQARQRQYRYAGQKRWRLGAVINSLMMLLHISVFLFFAGLIVFLEEVDSYQGPVFQAIFTLFAATFAVYAIISSLPLVFPDCPYRFPLMKVFRVWMLQKLRKQRRGQTTFREQELATIDQDTPVVEAAALAWLLRVSETSKEKEDVEDAALAAMDQLTQTHEQRNAMLKEGILNTLYRLFLDCDEHEEDRMIRMLPAIEALWKSDENTGVVFNGKDRRVPADDLHIAFFNKLVDILETSQSQRLLAAAIQLPKQFSGFPVAEWPIASRLSIPKMVDQLESDRYNTEAGLIAALNVITRIFRFSRTGMNKRAARSITQEDLRRTIPCVSEILILSRSTAVNTSALGVVDEIYEFFDHSLDTKAPSGWLKDNIDLFLNPKGLMSALLTQLSSHSRCRPGDKMLVRQVLDYLLRSAEIREDCVSWVISQGYLEDIAFDMKTFVWKSDMNVDIITPVYIFDLLSQEGRFTERLDQFMAAGSIEALAAYFSREQNPVPAATVYAGLLRRLLRLVNLPQITQLRQSRVMEIMAQRCPRILPDHLRPEAQQDLSRQMDLVREYLRTGQLDPRLEPPVQIHEEDEQEGDEAADGVDGVDGESSHESETGKFLPPTITIE